VNFVRCRILSTRHSWPCVAWRAAMARSTRCQSVLFSIRAWLLAAAGLAILFVLSAHAQGSPRVDSGGPSASDAIAQATKDYARTGVARTVQEGAFVSFPYGHSQPTVTCAPLRACVIELEAGETVLSKIAGDTQRWEIQLAPAGPDGRTPLIVVKPHDCGLTTNLVLATTAGRIYDLTLDSPACSHSGVNPSSAYIRHVRFYYPDSMVESWAAPAAAPVPPANAPSIAETITKGPGVEALNFDYRVSRDKGFPWMPAAVFDDGAHCYIKLPAAADHREAPVLFVLAEDGSKTLLNYTMSGDIYITDRVFRAAVLVVGQDGHERELRLRNRRYDAPKAEAGGR
jgi:type IV secretion system protein TrbG